MTGKADGEPKVLFAQTEAYPFIQNGGLGDVVGSLPLCLRGMGLDVRVIVPLMSCVGGEYRERMEHVLTQKAEVWVEREFSVMSLDHEGVVFYFVDCKDLYDRENTYGYWDDGERMGFFQKAVAEFIRGSGYTPDIIHCNDWHTSLLPLILFQDDDIRLRSIKTVLTIHNVFYQGSYGAEIITRFPKIQKLVSRQPKFLKFMVPVDSFNFLTAGMLFQSVLTTVSETHALEIMPPESQPTPLKILNQEVINDLLFYRGQKIRGIPNGIDMDLFDPGTNPALAVNYGPGNLEARKANKAGFQAEMGISEDPDAFLIVYSGRLAEQKGIDDIIDAVPSIIGIGAQIVVIGSDSCNCGEKLERLHAAYGGRFAFRTDYDRDRQQRSFSAADIVIMPSIYEPCGLVQMIAMRYGAVPVCRRTGGLADTVSDMDGPSDTPPNGFLYSGNGWEPLFEAVERAYGIWREDPAAWKRIQLNGMARDSSWHKSAARYLELYGELLGTRGCVRHDSRDPCYRDPPGAVPVSSGVTLRLKADGCDSVGLRLFQDGARVIPMHRDGDYFAAEITVPDTPMIIRYDFVVRKGGYSFYYGNNTKVYGGVGEESVVDPEKYQITAYRECPVPAWYKEAVIYQIYPDRFFRGSDWKERAATIDEGFWLPQHRNVVTESWDEVPTHMFGPSGKLMDWSFSGGTLKGIEEKIPYLESMGVSFIYLNPIFMSPTNHHYDVADYERIDPLLGDERSFADMVSACRRSGIGVILDGVFNHTGDDSVYFDRYGRFGGGAYGNPDSRYQTWYDWMDGSCTKYFTWFFDQTMPKISGYSMDFRDYICGEGGVLDKWMSLGVAGWRLDAAENLSDDFLDAVFRKVDGNGGVTMGEVTFEATSVPHDGTLRDMISRGYMHSTTGYPIHYAIRQFLSRDFSAREFSEFVLQIRENYPPEQFYSEQVFLSCHDGSRILTHLHGIRDDDQWAIRSEKMALTLMFSLPGIPMIYYGDEAGAAGDKDPQNRGPFPWGKEDRDLQEFYVAMIGFYKEHRCLVYGGLGLECRGDDVVVVIRDDGADEFRAVINRGDSEYDPGLGGEYVPVFPEGRSRTVPGPGATIFMKRRGGSV